MIGIKEQYLIDSNILIYAYDKAAGHKYSKAKEIINDCWKGKLDLAISSQNLAEFAVVSVKKGGLSFEQVKTIITLITEFDGFRKINYSSLTVISAVSLAHEHEMSFWDALIAATMKENSIFNIYTENTKDFKVPWLNSINPFAKE